MPKDKVPIVSWGRMVGNNLNRKADYCCGFDCHRLHMKALGYRLLVFWCIFDGLFTYWAWHSGLIIEENGLMLWTLQNHIFIPVKILQVSLVFLLVEICQVRWMTIAIWGLVGFYTVLYGRVLLQVI
jgi:hypothetical protein